MDTRDHDVPNAPVREPETVDQCASTEFPHLQDLSLLRNLSPRQREVFQWICEGKRDREIAQILGISYRTVTVHVRAILSRLGVENRTCAAMMGARFMKGRGDGADGWINTYLYVCFAALEMLYQKSSLG